MIFFNSVHVVCANDVLCPYKYLANQCRDDELRSLASFFLPTDTAVVACKCSFLPGDCFYPVLLSVCLHLTGSQVNPQFMCVRRAVGVLFHPIEGNKKTQTLKQHFH